MAGGRKMTKRDLSELPHESKDKSKETNSRIIASDFLNFLNLQTLLIVTILSTFIFEQCAKNYQFFNGNKFLLCF